MTNTYIGRGHLVRPFEAIQGVNRQASELCVVIADKTCYLPVTIDDSTTVDIADIQQQVEVRGTVRTYGQVGADGKRHNCVHIHASSIRALPVDTADQSYVHIQGDIYDQVTLVQKVGRDLAQTRCRVTRSPGRYYYVPVIAWSMSAQYLAQQPVGSYVDIVGSLISREYTKFVDGVPERRTTHEVVIARVMPAEVQHG